MDSALEWLTFVNFLFGGIATGALLFEFLVIVPAMARQPIERSALIHRMLLGELDLPSRVLPPAAMISGFSSLAILLVKDHQATAFTVLYAVGFVSMLSLGILTATISFPMNVTISKWPTESLLTPEGVPPEYGRIRQRWDRNMVVRSTAGTVAFVCFLLAGIGWG